MTTTISISDWTKEKLDKIRDEEEHTSFDSVVKLLLKESDRFD